MRVDEDDERWFESNKNEWLKWVSDESCTTTAWRLVQVGSAWTIHSLVFYKQLDLGSSACRVLQFRNYAVSGGLEKLN